MSKETSEEFRKKAWFSEALPMLTRLSLWVAIPVIIASFLGNYLDDKYDTAPWLLLVCVGVSFVFTMIFLVKETLKSFKDIENKELKK